MESHRYQEAISSILGSGSSDNFLHVLFMVLKVLIPEVTLLIISSYSDTASWATDSEIPDDFQNSDSPMKF